MYAKLLYNEFGKERVEKELEDYLSILMISRYWCRHRAHEIVKSIKNKRINLINPFINYISYVQNYLLLIPKKHFLIYFL